MERRLRGALCVLSFAFSPPALSTTGPQVPQVALSEVPEAVREGWRPQDEAIAQLTREIETARSARALGDRLDAVDSARRDLRAALTVASNLETEARSSIQAGRFEQVEARIRLDRAKLEVRLARGEIHQARKRSDWDEVRELRTLRREARFQRSEARDGLAAVTEVSQQGERVARDQLQVAEQAVASAQAALNDLGLFSTAGSRRRITASEIALLEARRDLAIAQLEHDRAVAVVESGGQLVLEPFATALEEARSAEGAARQASRPTATLVTTGGR